LADFNLLIEYFNISEMYIVHWGKALELNSMKYSKMLALGIVVFMLMATMATFAYGQSVSIPEQTGNTVSGYVRSSSNNSPISGAQIQIESNDNPSNYHTSSDGSGYYSIDLPPGDYHVTVTCDDYHQWETDFTMGMNPETRDIFLDPESSGGSIDNGGDDSGFEMPFGDMDEDFMATMMTILVSLVVTFFICLITITIALIVISSRLGKIRKELIALNESQKPKVQAAPAQPQYQQMPPPPPTE
jgi:hypothetical protein